MKIVSTLLLLGALVTGVYAQRPRATDPQPAAKAPPGTRSRLPGRLPKPSRQSMRAECLATGRRWRAR